jgi:hypothetical protein
MNFATPCLGLAAAAFAAVLAAQPPSATAPSSPQWTWPARLTNAHVLPADTPPDRLSETMRGFTRSLGVRCSHCHVGEESMPLSSYDFASDAKPSKVIARAMMRMVRRLNAEELSAIFGVSDQQRVTCYTCHRGSPTPERTPPPRPAQ